MSDSVRIEGLRLVNHTSKGLFVCQVDTPDNEVYLPHDQVSETDLVNDGDEGYAVIPAWLASDRDLRTTERSKPAGRRPTPRGSQDELPL